jgi:hypothetical protein
MMPDLAANGAGFTLCPAVPAAPVPHPAPELFARSAESVGADLDGGLVQQ